MRIISPFKDYYDIGMGLGHAADDVVYVRESREVPWFRVNSSFGYPVSCVPITIGFCGKIYTVMRVSGSFSYQTDRPYALCYSIDDVDRFVESHCDKRDRGCYAGTNRRWKVAERRQIEQLFAAFGDRSHAVRSRYMALFREHNVPIFLFDPSLYRGADMKIILNPILRKYEFARIFDPYSAFQEVSMYVGGVLNGQTRPVPDMPDDVLAEAKGFDRWSFRKPPSR